MSEIHTVRRQYAQPRPFYAVPPERVREAELRAWLRAQLAARGGGAEFGSLLAARPSPAERCALFSALLHGCQAREWSLQQGEPFGVIQVASRQPGAEASRSNPAADPVVPRAPA